MANIDGTPDGETLEGTSDADVIRGFGGNDILEGKGGADRLEGGTGDDTFFLDLATDTVIELAGEGFDALYTHVSYVLAAGADVEWLSTSWSVGTAAIDLTGNEIANFIIGNDGNNKLNGGGGADVMSGGMGNDTYYVDDANDVVAEFIVPGYWSSDIILSSVSYTLAAGVNIKLIGDVIQTGSQPLNFTGNEIFNHLYGNRGANILNGGAGPDHLWGGEGNDTYIIDDVGDVIEEVGGNGFDSIYTSISYSRTGASVEWLSTTWTAGTDAINLTGGNIQNYLIGNQGANVLDGGLNRDVLVGYGGNDTFAFTTQLGSITQPVNLGTNIDTITDFTVGADKIALDDAIFTQIGGPGALNANAFVTGTAAADADDRIVYNAATGDLFYDADGNGAGAQILFANLFNHAAVSASDFQVI